MGEAASKARAVMNWLSYFAVEDLAWLGMAGMVKNLRQNVFGLKSWDKYSTSHALYHSKVSHNIRAQAIPFRGVCVPLLLMFWY